MKKIITLLGLLLAASMLFVGCPGSAGGTSGTPGVSGTPAPTETGDISKLQLKALAEGDTDSTGTYVPLADKNFEYTFLKDIVTLGIQANADGAGKFKVVSVKVDDVEATCTGGWKCNYADGVAEWTGQWGTLTIDPTNAKAGKKIVIVLE